MPGTFGAFLIFAADPRLDFAAFFFGVAFVFVVGLPVSSKIFMCVECKWTSYGRGTIARIAM